MLSLAQSVTPPVAGRLQLVEQRFERKHPGAGRPLVSIETRKGTREI